MTVAVQFFLPSERGITVHIGHNLLGFSIRWVVLFLQIDIDREMPGFQSGMLQGDYEMCALIDI